MAGDVALDSEMLRRSFLGSLAEPVLEGLLADAIRLDIPAGAVAYRDWETPRTAVILSGLLRVYIASSSGRQRTLRYARGGEVVGAPVAVGGPVGVSVQALLDTSVLVLNVSALQALGQSDARFAWA